MSYQRLRKIFKIIAVTNPFSLLKFLLSTQTNFKAAVAGKAVFLRPRTTDLKVAVDSLTDEFDALIPFSKARDVTVIVDAGGYIGTAAMRLAELYPNAVVLSIEASEINYSMLLKNTKGHENIIAINAALSGTTGKTLELYNRGTGNWGLTALDKKQAPENAELMHEITTICLDSLTSSYGKIDLLKIDIEGGEYRIFRENTATLQEIPLIFAELHDRIIPGCTDAFLNIPGDRKVVNLGGEKLLSIKHSD